VPQKNGLPTLGEKLNLLEEKIETISRMARSTIYENQRELAKVNQRCDGLAEQASNHEDRVKRELHRVEQLGQVNSQRITRGEEYAVACFRRILDDPGTPERGDADPFVDDPDEAAEPDSEEIEEQAAERAGAKILLGALVGALIGIVIGSVLALWKMAQSLPTCILT
jgi:tetrahydromethanopterin S-methyltransferase subunit G